MRTVTFSQFRNNAKKYFDAVEKGETLEIYRHGRPIALVSSSHGASEGPFLAGEEAAPYATGKNHRLAFPPLPSTSRELLRDRGKEVIPIAQTKRFIRSKFGALGTGGTLLKELVREKGQEKEREAAKWRRRKK